MEPWSNILAAILKRIVSDFQVHPILIWKLCEIADAVGYLHENNIVHGDIKGSNVLVDDDIHCLLCDFGLSKAAPSRTSTGMQGVGALRWQSPELWTGGAKSFSSDTYAFAMTIVEVLTGEVPFSNIENDTAVIVAVLQNDERPPKLPESLFGVSYKSTWEVADACWPKKPADRISMNFAFQRLKTQASDYPPEEAPKVDGAESSGHAQQEKALYDSARPSQPLPQQQQVQESQSRRKVGLEDFHFLAVLGKGNLGKVMLAEEKKTNSWYAIKVVKKEFIIDNDQVEGTRSTKRVFLAIAREHHPFLLGLHSCFQTETRVYFVMEYVGGGDLMLHIQRKQFSIGQAKFYAQEVLLALEYFHSQGIVYRDLKLDHILLTLDGHVKVADYGLCKEGMWHGCTTGTFCGTAEFMAPEILTEQKYGRAVDWWAFGVILYQMFLGQSPFRGDDEDEVFDAIIEDEPLYPITMPRDAMSIVQKLLIRDPNRRLGGGEGDAEEIKRHRFFKDTNWGDVLNKRIPPPYFPTVTSTTDTSNFDAEFTRQLPTFTPVHRRLSAQDQAEFQDFDWVADWADT
ncbi:hypothetical protein M407DRAFT_18165 [Tulasnella calospora MUT 4182]|uniref:protein kinase C n=1 Tax=Tulasnella calospora MUT 4182 TaxID=1051891 RepID=A0A0C3QKG1_9AGAM|nr:hypothetical protein M407DRAFT_18165 [Tulasnella calospora MUT 4182]